MISLIITVGFLVWCIGTAITIIAYREAKEFPDDKYGN